MKLLFFSRDKSEVSALSKELESAGIACQIRRCSKNRRNGCCFGEAEIWLQHDRDCHRALLLCVERGVGFAKRPPRNSAIESWTDITSGTRFAEDDDFSTNGHSLDRDLKTCSQRIRKLKAA